MADILLEHGIVGAVLLVSFWAIKEQYQSHQKYVAESQLTLAQVQEICREQVERLNREHRAEVKEATDALVASNESMAKTTDDLLSKLTAGRSRPPSSEPPRRRD